MRRLLAPLSSPRTSAWLLGALTALMLVNVLVPQADGVAADAYRRAVERGGAARFWLETVGLGHVSTSPVFVAMLALFFVSLAAVLIDRTGATLRRMRAAPPSVAQLASLLRRADARDLRGPIAPDAARRVLEGFGYRVAAGEGTLWGVKHASAVLGFPLFHLSFFVLCAAGAQLYYTRQVGTAIVIEGQSIEGDDLAIVRRSPLRQVAPLRLALQRVDVVLRDGKPTDLAATVLVDEPGAAPETARVNHPVDRGPLSILVERAGLAPVIRVQDFSGLTLDRVALALSNERGPASVTLGATGIGVTVDPIPMGTGFPVRAELPGARLRVRVFDAGKLVHDGTLAPGDGAVRVGDLAVDVEEIRYWAFLRFVHEEGGELLGLGFALAVVGITWRLAWFRREIVVGHGGGRAILAGRGELFPSRIQAELDRIARHLERRSRDAPGEGRAAGGGSVG